jgi:hypothetical protein
VKPDFKKGCFSGENDVLIDMATRYRAQTNLMTRRHLGQLFCRFPSETSHPIAELAGHLRDTVDFRGRKLLNLFFLLL